MCYNNLLILYNFPKVLNIHTFLIKIPNIQLKFVQYPPHDIKNEYPVKLAREQYPHNTTRQNSFNEKMDVQC